MNKLIKQMSGYVCILAGLSIAGANVAQADVFGWGEGDVVTVSGMADFVKRRTLTPQYCPDYRPDNTGSEGCLKGKTYWALSIESAGMRYELDQILAEGEDLEPESLVIGGVVVRPSVSISITARASVVNRGYSVLTDLQEVVILDRSLQSGSFFGWTCESLGDSQPVYVDIYQNSQARDYSMRVQTMVPGEGNPRTLASLDGVSAELTDSNIQFSGANKSIQADLAIDARGGLLNGRESLLTITT